VCPDELTLAPHEWFFKTAYVAFGLSDQSKDSSLQSFAFGTWLEVGLRSLPLIPSASLDSIGHFGVSDTVSNSCDQGSLLMLAKKREGSQEAVPLFLAGWHPFGDCPWGFLLSCPIAQLPLSGGRVLLQQRLPSNGGIHGQAQRCGRMVV